MKIFLLLFGLLSVALPTHSQVLVLGKNLTTAPDVAYIKVSIWDEREEGITVIRASVDYGQNNFFKAEEESALQTPDGQLKTFKSDMDVFNFLHQNGWEYLNSWSHYFATEPPDRTSGESYQYHLFRKKKL
jgi:hypothetical protein